MTTGEMEALHLAVLCTVAAGDEVVIPTPVWPNYFIQARLADADSVEIPFLAPETDEVSVPLAERLLREGGVVPAPGAGFGGPARAASGCRSRTRWTAWRRGSTGWMGRSDRRLRESEQTARR